MAPGEGTMGDAERRAAVDELTLATALLYFRMRIAAEQLLGEGAQSAGRRSILKSLFSGGPQTVPQLARARSVSRQHIQKLVNGLRSDSLVELTPNPAHKRSHLVALTDAGRQHAAATLRRESKILPRLAPEVSLADLRTTTRTLLRLKAAFEGEAWKRLCALDGDQDGASP